MLRYPYMLKVVRGNTDLELEALSGQSFRVVDIMIYNPASSYVTANVSKTTVGYFRVGGELGSHLPFTRLVGDVAIDDTINRVYNQKTILGLLKELGEFEGFPVASGDKFTLSGAAQAGAIQLVVYEEWEEGDITRDMPNGPEADNYLYLNYGNSGAAINKTGDTIYDNAVTPGQFPSFPFGDTVPAQASIELIGILGSDFAPNENDGTDYILTRYLKLYKDREVLFDDDLNGLLMESLASTIATADDYVGLGASVVGNFSDVDAKKPFLLKPKKSFVAGEELQVILTTENANSGQNISTTEQEICFVQRVTRI